MNEAYKERGDWDSEPDNFDFEHAGYKCALRRNSGGAWCGYVGIDKLHPWYGKEYGDKVAVPEAILKRNIDLDKIGVINLFCANLEDVSNGEIEIVLAVDVHGGITYSNDGVRGAEEGLWWFGFDCAHSGDLCPKYDSSFDRHGIYRDMNYAKRECQSMAEQISAFAADVQS